MNYNNPQLISALAAEYVLGTLRGKARERFESLKFGNEDVAREINYWEAHLNEMALHLKPIQPRDYVLQNIRQRLGFTGSEEIKPDSLGNESNVVQLKADSQKASNVNVAWKWWSGLATAAALILAVFVTTNLDLVKEQQAESIAVISNAEAKALWSIDVLNTEIRVKVTASVPRLANNDYELWIVPASGGAPISLGVMQQSGEFYLSKPSDFDNIEIAALAVSKEPKGGSPTGAPTEVLYATELAYL
jgi:anti-sigma-K factor RskA